MRQTKSKMRGGSDLPINMTEGIKTIESHMPQMLKNAMPMPRSEQYAEMSAIPDVVALSGGRKKRVVKKPVAAADKKKPVADKKKKKGGALVDDMKNLAVPFAILLAQQGLKGMLNKNNDSKRPASSRSASSRSNKSKSGGSGCSSCAATPLAGGASRYAKLSEEIDKFLAKY
jgi:hypothetical protein